MIKVIWVVLTLLFSFSLLAAILGPDMNQLVKEYSDYKTRSGDKSGLVSRLGNFVNEIHFSLMKRKWLLVLVFGAVWVTLSAILVNI
jgi:hypothetical protein